MRGPESKVNVQSESGFASNPDATKTHADVDQARWLQESKNVINRLIQGLPKTSDSSESSSSEIVFTTFEDSYRFLAGERHRIAADLGHGRDFGRTQDFGKFRVEYAVAFESVWLTSQKPQAWQSTRESIHDLFGKLIDKIETKNQYDKIKGKPYHFKDDTCICRKRVIKKKKSGKKYIVYELTVKSPIKDKVDGFEPSQKLARIIVREFVDKTDAILDPDFALMRIFYADVNKYDRFGDFALANRYYLALLNGPGSGSEKNKLFLENAGRLAHLLAHLLPVSRGNASIVEWMLRGLAFKNGIDLGPFNYSEKVGWDFKAFFNTDREEYAKWFCESAFANVRVLTKQEMEKGFVFREPSRTAVVSQIPMSSHGVGGGMVKPASPPAKLLHEAMPLLGQWYNFLDEGFALQCRDKDEAKKLSENLSEIFSGLDINVSCKVTPSNLAFVMINLPDPKKLEDIFNLKKEELAKIKIDHKEPIKINLPPPSI